MKYQFALFVLAVAFVSLQAASLRQFWYDLAPAAGEIGRGGLGDIWSPCSEYNRSLYYLRYNHLSMS